MKPANFRSAATYQHGPSDRPMVPCPDCGAPLDVQEQIETLTPATDARRIAARVAFCTGCEFVKEF